MVHDFGCRGADSEESAALVGGAILQHFKGTDTIPALRMCAKYYAIKCAGGSVVATEHSVMGALGPEGEEEMWNGVWDTFATPGGVVSIVGDTYSIMRAVTKIVRGMRDKVMASGCRLVIRPDSSKNVEHTCQIIEDILVELAKIFGSRTNSKGCEVLKDCVRVLWGDGNNEVTLDTIMSYLMFKGWSVENMIFGIGGEWHSNQIRDTHKCAYKSSAQKREETWYDVYKDPDTDPGKVSYRGIVSTYLFGNEVATLRRSQADSPIKAHRCPPIIDLMEDVYYNGELKRFQTFDEIRELTLTPYYKAVN
jgi:nicotinamide phosphoribosyltransferase